MKNFNFTCIVGLALTIFAGCSQATSTQLPPLPTLLPTTALIAEVPTVTPTIPPTLTSTPTPIPPTLTPTPDLTLPTITPTPDLSIQPAVNITSLTGEAIQAGQPLVVSGRAARRSDQRLEAALWTLDGRLLIAEQIEEVDFGAWESKLPLPDTFSGQARFVINVWNVNDNPESSAARDSVLVNIVPDIEQNRYLQVDRPGADSKAAAGYYLFFDGYAQRPVDFVVTIAIKADDCQKIVSRQRYLLNGSGSWRGFLQIPETVTGEACAIAWFGDEESTDRREAQYLINVVPKNEAKGTKIGSPQTGGSIRPGETVFFQGTTWNATGGTLDIQVQLADGSVTAGDTVDVDKFGYWEANLLMPVDISGEIQVTADGGTGSDSILLNVEE
ncbi:MAG: hypothetical protein ACI9EW_002277 [Cellvibrionaceae bacterium]|jgi:hypothetical protein